MTHFKVKRLCYFFFSSFDYRARTHSYWETRFRALTGYNCTRFVFETVLVEQYKKLSFSGLFPN